MPFSRRIGFMMSAWSTSRIRIGRRSAAIRPAKPRPRGRRTPCSTSSSMPLAARACSSSPSRSRIATVSTLRISAIRSSSSCSSSSTDRYASAASVTRCSDSSWRKSTRPLTGCGSADGALAVILRTVPPSYAGGVSLPKRIGFLSFGHWSSAPGSQTRTAAEALHQHIELAVAAEELGLDGAYVRVHHFARQLASPFPLLAAMAARTSRIELGTAVIDMRYESPLYMAEEAAATDLISGGRLQLGISRGSPEPAERGSEAFGHVPGPGQTDAALAREHTDRFLEAITGTPVVNASREMGGAGIGRLAIQPQSPGLRDRIWWGSGTRRTAVWTAE